VGGWVGTVAKREEAPMEEEVVVVELEAATGHAHFVSAAPVL